MSKNAKFKPYHENHWSYWHEINYIGRKILQTFILCQKTYFDLRPVLSGFARVPHVFLFKDNFSKYENKLYDNLYNQVYLCIPF